ncbi:hypothetical protein [Streptomyces catenulae]|uniref:Uncharacterized protein n=1 Tax=Streptomyces catenulae TaxID=66875 RepID=A0ABV2YTY7_9ACTN|nr:hypothetical protein [Streptomyces catenulae]
MHGTPADRSAATSHLTDTDPAHHVRILPWTADGKLCVLSTSGPGSFLSRLADSLEETQLAAGRQTLDQAHAVLSDPMSPYGELRYAGIRLAECLRDALYVAESRGLRMTDPDEEDPDSEEPADPTDPPV